MRANETTEPWEDIVANGDRQQATDVFRVQSDTQVENDDGLSPLAIAVDNENHEVVAYLLEIGADPMFESGDILCTAVDNADLVSVRLLLAAGADPNARGYSHFGNALVLAVTNRHLDLVQCLLSAGADPRAVWPETLANSTTEIRQLITAMTSVYDTLVRGLRPAFAAMIESKILLDSVVDGALSLEQLQAIARNSAITSRHL